MLEADLVFLFLLKRPLQQLISFHIQPVEISRNRVSDEFINKQFGKMPAAHTDKQPKIGFWNHAWLDIIAGPNSLEANGEKC